MQRSMMWHSGDSENVEQATAEIFDDLVDEVLMGFVFDAHRRAKCGIADAEEGIEEDNAFKIIDGPGLDVFGEPMTRKTGKCTCPNCDNVVTANRFATHLEKCLGMGRNSSRLASQRISNNAARDRQNSRSGDENDEDWSLNKKRKRKSAKKSKAKKANKPLRELGRLWHGTNSQANVNNQPTILTEVCSSEPASGLPLLQVWPSDSPRGEADGEAFVFPDVQENVSDSGIESIQRLEIKASPSPGGANSSTAGGGNSPGSTTPQQSRRPSLLHPDHARLHHHRIVVEKPGTPDEEPQPPSPSSSTTSSLRSMPSSAMTSMSQSHERRRSSRYSMFDALDLEYALLRAAARGSVGPYSLSESLHKLTFTQSLAFPALARGLASKKSEAEANKSRHSDGQQLGESGMNVFARVVTALVLVLVSVLVFGVVYKFVRT